MCHMFYLNVMEQEENTISFSVDAGLIDRLGRELVGEAETAVSELVKNSYDADANNVIISFFFIAHNIKSVVFEIIKGNRYVIGVCYAL